MKTKFLLLLVSLFIFLEYSISYSQEMTGLQVMRNMQYKFKEVQDYTVDIEANVKMEKIRMPKIKMKMYYKNPDKFHYESSNFALLPKGGINFNPLNYDEENYDYNLKGQENLNGINTYIIEVIKKKTDIKTKDIKKKQPPKDPVPEKSTIWVDAERWVAKKISSEPNEKRSLSVLFTHTIIDNKYCMPSTIEVEFNVPETNENPNEKDDRSPAAARPKRGNPGKGTVSLILKNYVLNSGLSDDIFKDTNKKK
jgi:outer membrane lipoprotein-sorting protein